jgi:hypothetical protein
MMPLGTDLETHAKWHGSIEEPTAKDFVARKICTIELNKVQGIDWNLIKCKEGLGNRPEAVVRQATISLYSQVLKYFLNFLPEMYCVDLAEDYVMRENVRSRNFA